MKILERVNIGLAILLGVAIIIFLKVGDYTAALITAIVLASSAILSAALAIVWVMFVYKPGKERFSNNATMNPDEPSGQ